MTLVRVLLLLLTLVPGLAQNAAQNSGDPFISLIEGVVRESRTGKPIGGVNVHVFEASRFVTSPSSAPAVTDAQGRFTLNVTRPGTYRIFPEKSGWVYSRPAQLRQPRTGIVVRVPEGGKTLKVDLSMVAEGSISGEILDVTTGQPIPSATVGVASPAFDSLGNVGARASIRPTGSAIRTNDRGEFRVYGLQPGDYYLSVYGGAFGTPARYYPGVNEVAKATVIHVEEGRETRVASMLMESPSRAVQVRLRFMDPSVTTLGLSIEVLGTDTNLGTSSPMRPISPPREMLLTLARGPYDLLIAATSRENDLLYAREMFEVGTQEMTREITLTPGIRVTGAMKLEDANGKTLDSSGIRCFLRSASPAASAQSAPYGCLRSQVASANYSLELSDMPPDAYVASAKSGDRDILRDGLVVERDTRLEIALATPGAVIGGAVTNDKGERLSDATVVLVPDVPYRDAGPLYRTDVSAYDGTFELRGVAVGNYLLFAWSDLQGPAYRNTEFLKTFETRGNPLKVEKGSSLSVDLVAIE